MKLTSTSSPFFWTLLHRQQDQTPLPGYQSTREGLEQHHYCTTHVGRHYHTLNPLLLDTAFITRRHAACRGWQ